MPDYRRMLQTLEDGTFSPARFNHEDHVALGFQAIHEHGPARGMQVFDNGLKAAAERLGLTGKYHATVTMAYLSLIAERMETGDATDVESFLAENPDLLEAGLLKRFYTTERLASPLARAVFLLPDRAA